MSAIVMIVLGILGLIAHWASSYRWGEASTSLATYFFVANRKASVRTLALFSGAMAAWLATGPELSMASAAGAFMVGFGLNAVSNSDKY